MLIAGLLVTGCHDKMENEYISNPVTVKTEEFDKAFKEAFTSKIDPNQDWGFGTTKKRSASTRSSQTNDNQWGTDDNNGIYKDFPRPADITAAEREAVLAVFNQKGAASYTALVNYDKFFVQQVYCGPKGNDMTQLACVTNTGARDECNNFNNGKYSGNAEQGCMLMFDSSTSSWSYKTTQGGGERWPNHFRMEQIGGYYYVGLDFESRKQGSDANENEQFERDYIYNDWIVKIVPGIGSSSSGSSQGGQVVDNDDDPVDDQDNINNPGNTSDITKENPDYQQEIVRTEYFQKRRLLQYGRVFCEDLGANYNSNRKDFDYNDVVFDAYLNRDEWWKKTTRIKVYEVRKFKKMPDLERQKEDENKNPVFELVPQKDDEGHEIKDEQGNIVYDKVPVMEKYNALVYQSSETRIPENEVQIHYDRVSDTNEITSKGLDLDGRGRRYYANILLMACGATKPIKVGAKENGSPVTEVHEAFGGYAVDCIINTFDTHSEREGGFGYHELAEPVRLPEMEIPLSYITVDNPTIKDIPIFIQGGATEARVLEAEKGGVPQKFMSTTQDKWTSERCFLGDAYPNFTSWAEDKNITYSSDPASEHLYCGSYPSHEQNVLPFGVTTGAESTVCKDITKKEDVATPNTSLIIYETTDGSEWPTEGWVVYDKDVEFNGGSGSGSTTEKTTTPPTGNTGSASWSSTSYNGSNGGQELISSTTLTNAGFDPAKGVTLTIKGDCWNWGGPGWSVNVKDGNNNSIFQASNSNSNGASVTYNDYKATVVISLSSTDFGRVLSSAGLHIECNFTNASSMNISITQ